jgi:hypothetical protein
LRREEKIEVAAEALANILWLSSKNQLRFVLSPKEKEKKSLAAATL